MNKLAAARRETQRRTRSTGSDLSSFLFEAAETKRVQFLAVEFVAKYGPLILDFGTWCADTEYGAFVSRHPASAYGYGSILQSLGNERFLWPREWRRWATGVYSAVERHLEPRPRVPAPVAFYVWAACMLTALHQHPEWLGCQLFLANRLASLRLVFDEHWLPEITDHLKPHQGPRLAARLDGDLLDYLAVAAARKRRPGVVHRVGRCENCGLPFSADDGRRWYCPACSKLNASGAIRSQRYRDRHRNQLR